MSDSTDTDKKKKPSGKPLGLSRPGKLELKKTVESGSVRQSFSHGRSKMVQVEVKKKRTYKTNSTGSMAEIKDVPKMPEIAEAPPKEPEAPQVPSSLTNEERAARARALQDAKTGDDKAEKMPPPPPRPEPKSEVTKPEPEAPVVDEEAKRQAEEEDKAVASAAAEKLKAAEEGDSKPAKPKTKKPVASEQAAPKRPTPKRGEKRRRSGKLTIAEALGDGEERTRSLASVRRAREKEKQKQKQVLTEGKKIVRDVVIPETITVQELANRMAERANDVIKALMKMDVMASINEVIDADTAELLVSEFGHNLKRVSAADVEIGLKGTDDDDEGKLQSRAPVVTVMGHVDHGKTSLLDALRATDVAGREAGGITQHIGAYQVTLESGDKITFIDTPGHAAFTDMRARGASVTDIVILVVAADDGIMPQTIEAIAHAKAAEVPIIVAINKMDVEGADANRVRTELLQHDLVVEEMGGEVLTIEVSAKEKTNLDKLEEAILLQSELLDLKANPERAAEGVVIEAKMEVGRGSVATILVQRGTLNAGDIFVAGGEWGRVRALIDDHGNDAEQAGPSMPVEVLGLNGTPSAGDEVAAVDNEARAREVTEFRMNRERDVRAAAGARGTLEQMFEKIGQGEAQYLPIVVKADAHGSVEAIQAALEKMSTDEVKAQVLHSGVGGINESDITLANASGGMIAGFNVRANPQARDMAKRDGVEIRYYSIIYDLTDDVKKALTGMLAPTLRETLLGYAKVQEVFSVSKVGKVAGCIITEGQVKRGSRVRLLRDDVVIHEGELSQLKRFKDDVKDVKEGTECGMAFANYQDIQSGDMIECFDVEEVARELGD
ncbi:MAG: translation initiation factor IF-2 [Rhodospirillaceae bacterium]|jgi:translation initiation factor IF-2|nr:translation initiation factor IF-2 [Rhodospirillaceae bacterium]MBT5012939.1 translation initiation factor IF-2 [Rhodospirillaceae bacterium]MBT5307979.1 translation initiation factor IF-2 [Rhodospirillaceae bacterium]MBT6406550.1 translation initiation factor IF-2 [Rhodospirillaceae bacterium]MBT7356478.1 translation initiation factor IF-2 [Rhodospirillaceae bacterium]